MSDKTEATTVVEPPVEKRTAPKRVVRTEATITNLTRYTVVVLDNRGEGVHLAPRQSHSLPADQISSDMRRKAKVGLVRID